MPLQHAGGDVLGQLEVLAHAIAVVVVRDVLAPVHQRRPRLPGLLAVVVGVHFLVAAVGFNHRRDEDDHVVADGLDERSLLDDQAIRELHRASRGPPVSGEWMPLVIQ